jgi:hypothetical protein
MSDRNQPEVAGKKSEPDPRISAIAMVMQGFFPEGWKFVPVKGKATFIKNWTEAPLDSNQALHEAYHQRPGFYRGVGVLTGRHSKGLVAIDIDGLTADERYRQALDELGGSYEPLGEESTMSWTSGKEGRRQLLYQVPWHACEQLNDLKTLILRMDGSWEKGQGDMERTKGGADYEEVVVRFNGCQSVLPGSPHPSGSRYRFLNYNGGKVAPAPGWLVELLRPYYKPVAWLDDDQIAELRDEVGETLVPAKQIRGWVFREDSPFHKLLMPRLDELVFKKDLFPEPWQERDGDRPQRLNFCPWHGGLSGTSFQYNPENGCWDCKACAVGGDWLDFLYKIHKKDINAKRPMGPTLEKLVAELSGELGLVYPDAAREEQTVKNAPLLSLTPFQFFESCQQILDRNGNSEVAHFMLMRLVRDCGMQWMYRNGTAVEMALDRFLRKKKQADSLYDPQWQAKARNARAYLIPDFISAPSSVMLHARGGMGKTRVALALAKVVGRRLPMRIRGAEVLPTQQGNVLLIGNDMSMADYAEYLDQQGIHTDQGDSWLKFHADWQQDEYKRLIKWLQQYKPAMVIIDSLTSCSTEIEAKENEKEYSNTMYKLARENGVEFPPTVFLWIHHNTKDGNNFRGTDTLRNAVHETWELLDLGEEERHDFPENSIILQVDKSRSNRSRARFLIEESIDEVLSIKDLTPAVEHYRGGQGPAKPSTVLLGLLGEADGPMTMKELKYALDARLSGERGEGVVIHRTTVLRWLEGWISKGLVEKGTMRQPGSGPGRPEATYKRVSPSYEGNSTQNPPSFFQTPSGAGEEEECSELHVTTPEDDLHTSADGPAGRLTETPETTGDTPEVVLQDETPGGNTTPDSAALGVPPEDVSALSAPAAPDPTDKCAEGVLVTPAHKTETLETSSATGVFEDRSEFCAAETLVREQPVPERVDQPRWMGYRGGRKVVPEGDFDEAFGG